MNKRLYRSQSDKMVAGVCGGLAAHLGIDPTLVRLFFVLSVLANGFGILAYIVMWLVVPVEGDIGKAGSQETLRTGAEEIAQKARDVGEGVRQVASSDNRFDPSVLVGAALVFLGIVFFAETLNIGWLHWLNAGILWPGALILAGVLLLVKRQRRA